MVFSGVNSLYSYIVATIQIVILISILLSRLFKLLKYRYIINVSVDINFSANKIPIGNGVVIVTVFVKVVVPFT